jgi:hypothetical protein
MDESQFGAQYGFDLDMMKVSVLCAVDDDDDD